MFFNNDDVDSLFRDESEVMENLVRGSSMYSESQLPGAKVDIVKAQSGYSFSTISRNPNTPRGWVFIVCLEQQQFTLEVRVFPGVLKKSWLGGSSWRVKIDFLLPFTSYGNVLRKMSALSVSRQISFPISIQRTILFCCCCMYIYII